ncbi:MAG: hypothetical protein V4448_13900 [Pseudomonadota bacterium]
MPHVTVEYTSNLFSLDTGKILQKLNAALAASGNFEEADIKSRAIKLDDYVVGTSADTRARGFFTCEAGNTVWPDRYRQEAVV